MTPVRKIAAGDVLWYGGSRQRRESPRSVTVEKAGRSWITIADGRRFHASSLGPEHAHNGRLYLSEAEHVAERELNEAWVAFSRRVDRSWGPPTGLTLDAIRRAEALLWPASGDAP